MATGRCGNEGLCTVHTMFVGCKARDVVLKDMYVLILCLYIEVEMGLLDILVIIFGKTIPISRDV